MENDRLSLSLQHSQMHELQWGKVTDVRLLTISIAGEHEILCWLLRIALIYIVCQYTLSMEKMSSLAQCLVRLLSMCCTLSQLNILAVVYIPCPPA